MPNVKKPYHADSPQVTAEMMSRAKTFKEAFPNASPDVFKTVRHRGAQKSPVKEQITIRLSRDVTDSLRATDRAGAPWLTTSCAQA